MQELPAAGTVPLTSVAAAARPVDDVVSTTIIAVTNDTGYL
jgi:hypothetical protein